eukprot:Awhi_evm1s13052
MSYQVRRAPTSFNESRFIVLTSVVALFLLVVHYSFLLFLDVSGEDANFDFLLHSVYILANVLIVLGFFFGPKVYAIHYAKTSQRSDESKSGSSYSFDIPDTLTPNVVKTEKLKPWVREKWDCNMSASDQKEMIGQMIDQFNAMLFHAHSLSQINRAQRILLNNKGVAGFEQNNFITQYTSAHKHSGATSSSGNLLVQGSTTTESLCKGGSIEKSEKEQTINITEKNEILLD